MMLCISYVAKVTYQQYTIVFIACNCTLNRLCHVCNCFVSVYFFHVTPQDVNDCLCRVVLTYTHSIVFVVYIVSCILPRSGLSAYCIPPPFRPAKHNPLPNCWQCIKMHYTNMMTYWTYSIRYVLPPILIVAHSKLRPKMFYMSP